jgi:hypothetical protein
MGWDGIGIEESGCMIALATFIGGIVVPECFM